MALNKYTRCGGINPHYVLKMQEEAEREELERNRQSNLDYLKQVNQCNLEYERKRMDMYNQQQQEARCIKITPEESFEFLKRHSNSKEDLELAKYILELHK